MLAILVALAHAGEPIKFEETPLVVVTPKPQVEIVLAREEVRAAYDAKVREGVTSRILEMEKEQQLAETEPKR